MFKSFFVMFLFGIGGKSAFAQFGYDFKDLVLADFRNCLAHASGPLWNGASATCRLLEFYSPYKVRIFQPIIFSSPEVRRITGEPYWPVLQRDTTEIVEGTDPSEMLVIVNTGGHDVRIDHIVIDGNRPGENSKGKQVINCWTLPQTHQIYWVDVDARTSSNTQTERSGINFDNVKFVNAPGIPLMLGDYSTVFNSEFPNCRAVCIWPMSHTRITYNYFQDGGVAAVGVAGKDVYVGHNRGLRMHREFTHANEGSTFTVYPGWGSYVIFDSNEFDDGDVDCRNGCTGPTGCIIAPTNFIINGIELWDADHVVMRNNTFKHYRGVGYFVGSLDGKSKSTVWFIISRRFRDGCECSDYDNDYGGILVGGSQPVLAELHFINMMVVNNGAPAFRWYPPASPGSSIEWVGGCFEGNVGGPVGELPEGISGPPDTGHCQ